MNDLQKVDELITTLDDTVKRSGNINEVLKNSKAIVDDLNNLKNRISEVELKINDAISNLNNSVQYSQTYLNNIKEDFNKIKDNLLTKDEIEAKLNALEEMLHKKEELDEKRTKMFIVISIIIVLLVFLNLLLNK